MSTPSSVAGPAHADHDAPPVLVEPETRRLDGAVREASVPALARPVTYGSLADLPYDNAAAAPDAVVLSRKGPDGDWTDITADASPRGPRGGQGADRGGAGPRRPARHHGPHHLRVDAARLRGLGGGPGHRARLPDLLGLPDPLDPPGLRRGRARHRDAGQAAALGPELDRLPDLQHLWVIDKGARGPADRARRARPGRRGRRTARACSSPTRSPPSSTPRAPPAAPRAASSPTATSSPRSTTPIELLYPVFQVRRRRRASTLLFLPMSHVFGRMVADRLPARAGPPRPRPEPQGRRTPAGPRGLQTHLPPGHPVHPGEGLQHRPRQGRGERPGAVLRPRRRRRRALRRGRRGPEDRHRIRARRLTLRAARALYDPLVYRRIRNAMGGRVRHAICGGSPLGRRLAAFYAGAGIEIYEGYGLTETTAAATVTPPRAPRLGTVGWPLPGTAIRIAADGEILLARRPGLRAATGTRGRRRRRPRPPTAGSPPATSASWTTTAT